MYKTTQFATKLRWLIFTCLLIRWYGGQAQTPSLDQHIHLSFPHTDLATLIDNIDAQTPFSFSYDKGVLSKTSVDNINWPDVSLRKALADLYRLTGLQYAVTAGTIAVKLGPVPKDSTHRAGLLRGRVVDFETTQPLPNATVTMQETGLSVLTDEKGYYTFKNLPEGTYTVTVTYAGYQKNYLPDVRMDDGKQQVLDIKMQVGTSLSEVVIKSGAHRVKAVTHTTEKALIAEIRNATGVVSGISNEMIARTADRNAAEVVKRISGVTVVDSRFIVVRGMNERYNLTYLNDNVAPATELYSKAFAYDLLPSSIIDKILVYKSPRADLNGEFAGAAIKIYTKNAMPVRHFDIGVQMAHRPGSTLANINSYTGGKWDWLGVDDGGRKLPSFSPGYFQANRTIGNVSQADIVKEFSPILTYGQMHSLPDMQFFANYYDVFRLGKHVQLFDLTSVTYTRETTSYDVFRQSGNTDAYRLDGSGGGEFQTGSLNQIGSNQQTTETGKVNMLENLTLHIGRHNTLQLKNFFVNEGRKFTGVNDWRANAAPVVDSVFFSNNRKKDIILSFQQRLLYSGNLGGTHEWGDRHGQELQWNLGYIHDMQNVPDQRVSHFQTQFTNPNRFNSQLYEPSDLIYTAAGSNVGDANNGFLGMISRLFVKNQENNFNASLDYTVHLQQDLQVRVGTYQLFKTREVGRRFFQVNRAGLASGEVFDQTGNQISDGWPQGFGAGNPDILYWRLQDLGKIWNPANFPANNSGLQVYDATTPADSYTATEQNNAGYALADWKMADGKLTLNGGLRVEYDRQKLAGAMSYDAQNPSNIAVVWVDRPKTSVLPSANFSYRPDTLWVVRAGYGRTVDRPEFRELTPYNDFDFINNEAITGNPGVITATIDNYDLRAEFYPRSTRQDETFNFGVFYKHLKDPIERMRAEYSDNADVSSFTNISFANAPSAEVYGLEAEVKKSLSFIGGNFFRRLSIVLNGTLVKSTTRQYWITNMGGTLIDTVTIKGRPLQGQAPYALNAGLFYEHPGLGTKIGLTYNVTGPIIYAKSPARTIYASAQDSLVQQNIRPDLLQLPMSLLDLSVSQRIIKSLQAKLSIQNLLDERYRIVEDHNYNQRYDPERPKEGTTNNQTLTYYTGDNIYKQYKPGRYFVLAFTYAF